jgi:biopolymer transport protein ExbD
MDLNHLRSMLAPAFASLFLILLPVTFLVPRPAPEGIRIPLLSIHRNSHPYLACDGNPIFLNFSRDSGVSINGSKIPRSTLQKDIAEKMERRVERVVFLVADPQMSVQEFAQFFGTLKGSVPDLHVIVVSGEVRRALDENAKTDLRSPNSKGTVAEEPITLCDFVLPPEEFAH